MRLLLDTHALVWATLRSAKLSSRAHDLIADERNEVCISPVSAYEIEIKRGRDSGLDMMPTDLDEVATRQFYRWLPLVAAHAITAGRLPRLHGDPFDRLLAAQALEERMGLVSIDPHVAAFGCVVLW